MPFSSPPDPKNFANQVYAIVSAIPAGRVMTYGQVAMQLLPPAGMEADHYLRLAPRWVGQAMAHCPETVPWHRVINSQGKISLRPGLGANVQRRLLEQEGIVFDERERVDLKKFGWLPPGP